MANYSDLIQTINDSIKSNGNQEITGPVLNAVLQAMVSALGEGYQFLGIATHNINPGTPDEKVYYLALTEGIYTNFGLTVLEKGAVGVFMYDTSWHYNTYKLGSEGGNKILTWTTDSATTRKLVPSDERKEGLQISYKDPDKGWMNEQYIGTSFADNIWSDDCNWVNILSTMQLGDVQENCSLINPKNILDGYYIGDGGSQQSYIYAACTDFISVKPSTVYSFSIRPNKSANYFIVAYYNSSKSFIASTNKNAYTQIFRTPDSCAYIRVNIKYSSTFVTDNNTLSEGYYGAAGTNRFVTQSSCRQKSIENAFVESYNLVSDKWLVGSSIDSILVPSNGKRVMALHLADYDGTTINRYNFTTLTYWAINGSTGELVQVDSPEESDIAQIKLSSYPANIQEYLEQSKHYLVFNIGDRELPYRPLLGHFIPAGLQYSTTDRYSRFGYANHNVDVGMNLISEDDLSHTDYSIETPYRYLKSSGVKKVFRFEKGEGYQTGMSIPLTRWVEMKLRPLLYSSSYPQPKLVTQICASMLVSTDMPLKDFILSEDLRFYLRIKIIYQGSTKEVIDNAGFFNELKNMDGTTAETLTPGKRYVLTTYNSNKIIHYDCLIDVIDSETFRITCYWRLTISNPNTADDITGDKVEITPQIGIYQNSTLDFINNYYYEVSEPRFCLLNMMWRPECILNACTTAIIDSVNDYPNTVDDIPQVYPAPPSETFVSRNGFVNAKVTWLGTSVPNEPPFGEVKTKQYPQFVSSLLQFNLNNKSIGGSKMLYNAEEGIYGLSMTAEEAEEAGSAVGAEKSYQTQLNGLWDSDLFVFDHLHNDAGQLATLKGNPLYWDSDAGTFKITEENKFDRKWSVGAFNYVIAEIYRYNPRAVIAIINDWRAGFFYNKLANRVVADYWGIPICELRMSNVDVKITTNKDTYLKRYNGGADIKLLAGSSVNPIMYQSKSAPDETSQVVDEETSITFKDGSDSIHPGRYGRIMYAKQVARWLHNNVFLNSDTVDFY